jgi:hypothetical protein
VKTLIYVVARNYELSVNCTESESYTLVSIEEVALIKEVIRLEYNSMRQTLFYKCRDQNTLTDGVKLEILAKP